MLFRSALVEVATTLGITKVRFPGVEPLVRPEIVPLIAQISQNAKLKDIALTTNGVLLPRMAKELKDAGVTRLNISLDTLDRKKYQQITGYDRLHHVLKGIDIAKNMGFQEMKINVVLQKGINESEIGDFIALTNATVEVRFIELMPIGTDVSYAKNHYLSNNEIKNRFPNLVPCARKEVSSPATYYQLPGAQYRVGLISPLSCSFCSNCNRIRITSDKKLKLCLHSEEEIDLRESLKDRQYIATALLEAVALKPEKHYLNENKINKQRAMSQIGG